MLELNPYFRPSAAHLLKNKIFKEFDNQKVVPNFKIMISVDKPKFAEERLDGKSEIEQIHQLLRMIIKEYEKIKIKSEWDL